MIFRGRPVRSPPQATLLLAIAMSLAAILLFGSARLLFWASLTLGPLATIVFALHAWFGRRKARAAQVSGGPGRILEKREAEGRVRFELPALNIEPWGGDAWVLAVANLGAILASALFEVGSRTLMGLLSALTAVVGLRMVSAASDRLVLELSRAAWSVEAVAADHVIRRSGPGALLPELFPEALVLWSEEGRVGVLRWELEPEEREWLHERLIGQAATGMNKAVALTSSVL